MFSEVVWEAGSGDRAKVFFTIDSGVADSHPTLVDDITAYIEQYSHALELRGTPLIIPGGEQCKNDPGLVEEILAAVNKFGIDRHAYIVAIGGGAVLDMVGYAASIAHRGVRHVRIPTTVLSQNDSGIGVKNSVNAFNKKNFLGNFAPPFAVINDFEFLNTLHERDWRAGISEAIKVALIKDAVFFEFITTHATKLAKRDRKAMEYLIHRCAEIHMLHIGSGGDPFEMGSSRPLDFGHWAAHKLEQLTNYELRHGEAVAIGIALDSTYSYLKGMLSKSEWEQIMELNRTLGFDLYVPALSARSNDLDDSLAVWKGLNEFREHLGGKLTIMLLEKIGHGVETHQMDQQLITQSIELLKQYQQQQVEVKNE